MISVAVAPPRRRLSHSSCAGTLRPAVPNVCACSAASEIRGGSCLRVVAWPSTAATHPSSPKFEYTILHIYLSFFYIWTSRQRQTLKKCPKFLQILLTIPQPDHRIPKIPYRSVGDSRCTESGLAFAIFFCLRKRGGIGLRQCQGLSWTQATSR